MANAPNPLGPLVGAAGPRAVQIVAEVPPGVRPELEVRRERIPTHRTRTPPAGGWTGARATVAKIDRPGSCTHRFRVEGLDPRAGYRYRVTDGLGRALPGLSGRFRAVGQAGPGSRRFVLVSCNRPAAFHSCYRVVGARDYFGALNAPLNRRGYAIVTIDPTRPPASRVTVAWRIEPEIGAPLVDLDPVSLP